jgi:hypothetical protein
MSLGDGWRRVYPVSHLRILPCTHPLLPLFCIFGINRRVRGDRGDYSTLVFHESDPVSSANSAFSAVKKLALFCVINVNYTLEIASFCPLFATFLRFFASFWVFLRRYLAFFRVFLLICTELRTMDYELSISSVCIVQGRLFSVK